MVSETIATCSSCPLYRSLDLDMGWCRAFQKIEAPGNLTTPACNFEIATHEEMLAEPATVTHLVTLINSANQETSFSVITATEAFSDVMQEIAHQKVQRGLRGYRVYEALLVSDPF